MMPSAKNDLRAAAPEDMPALRENWRTSFGDSDDYLDFFFTRRFVPENTLVASVGGRVVSQLFLLPSLLRTQDGMLNADYLFAAATHPDFRRQGIMGTLLSRARSFCEERGKDAIVLLPGTRELYRYYAQYGYETAFLRRRWDVTRDELAGMAVPLKENDNAVSVLQHILSVRDGLRWDAEAIGYALAEHRAFRGIYATSDHAFVSVSGDEAFCLCDPLHFGECAALLLKISDSTQFTLIFPADLEFGTVEDGGMLCRLCDKTIHLRDAFISFAME